MITVTDSAVKQLQALISDTPENEKKGLRIYVEAGGCAGMQYGMTIDQAKEGDAIFDRDGGRIFIDEASMKYLQGSEIDFSDELTGAGFRIRNPNASRSCGCGSSFESAKEAPHSHQP